MATVTAGTGATVNATTIEGQLWQLSHLINSAEKGLTPQRLNMTKSDEFILEGDFTIPGQVVYNASTGTFSDSAVPYLSTLTFTAGSPVGTIKSTTLSQYFIDVVNYIIHWQNQPTTKNPNNLTNCTLSFDYNSLEYAGTIVLPYTSTMGANGSIIETATEWLTT
ncbi:hypothetical protein [Microcoleus asticus]|uniref:Uncharacterized protein n=1 Tax=Microcoleus asticus IPMA8 TaxID=2563858 RepID=A0ABX2D018_9CYAN|nr:hypothetical protein [Microcoleus asticus]NQE35203.1 hypothetical protein [Microcoleus asticus IPMA8]